MSRSPGSSTRSLPSSLFGQILVSCQAPPGDPLDDVDALCRIAASALRGGAGGLRANGPACIAAFRQQTALPIIGIFKQYDRNGAVQITPDLASSTAIAEAGADVIALDCTAHRAKTTQPWPELLTEIHSTLKLPVLADIATLEDGIAAASAGADMIATTLYGFTPETAGLRTVSWSLLRDLVQNLTIPVIAEGHITQPDEARRALDLGAFAVVVGAAITRPESITARFVHALRS